MDSVRTMIAAGDTIPESGLFNQFVINGGQITPEIMNCDLFTYCEDEPTGAPDSELGIIMHYDSSVLACKKRYISHLFPNFTNVIVNGEKLTPSQFDSIPAALLISVDGKDNGQTLVVTLRNNPNDPNPEIEKKMNEEYQWAIKNGLINEAERESQAAEMMNAIQEQLDELNK